MNRADTLTTDYVRAHVGREKAEGTRADITPDMIAAIESLRETIRREEGGGGMGALITEDLCAELGWVRMEVAYLSERNDVICCPYFVCLLSDGTIVDPTADQLGEGNSVTVLSPGDGGYGRYRPEFKAEFNPDTHPDLLGGWKDTWNGEADSEAYHENICEWGHGWWLEDTAHLERYLSEQVEFHEVLDPAHMDDSRLAKGEYLRSLLLDLQAKRPISFAA